jgi:hypothetical protein
MSGAADADFMELRPSSARWQVWHVDDYNDLGQRFRWSKSVQTSTGHSETTAAAMVQAEVRGSAWCKW